MNSRRVFVHMVTGIELSCLVGVFWLGARMLPVETEPVLLDQELVSSGPGVDSVRVLETDDQTGSDRTPCAIESIEVLDSDLGVRPVPAERRKERDYYLAFVRLAEHGTADVERAARLAIEGQGPDCEKVAALRAVSDTGCPGAFDLFADAIVTLPDVCRPQADSVPRFAVRVLAGRAAHEDRARQALERIAWNRSTPSDLRRLAAVGLAAVADDAGAWRIVSHLGIEEDARVRESVAQALALNPAAGSASAAAAQWIPPSPAGGEGGEQQE